MAKAPRDGLYLLLLGSAVFLLLGAALENAAPNPLSDFKALYYPARCLVQHCDPYKQDEVLRIYRAEGGDNPSDPAKIRQIATQNVYPPTAFILSVPFAMLPWRPAHILWTTLMAMSFLLASFLIWELGASCAPTLSGALIGFFLANSELLFITGNAAGLAISFCAVAACCFLRERYIPAGVFCLAVSLAVKPQDAGFVWMYFLLAGGAYRKRALQTLMATAALSLPAVLWVWRASPQCMKEWNFNLLAFSARGGVNDPGLASSGGHGLDMVVSLQSVISMFWDNARIYNPASYLVCGALLLPWALVTVRFRPSPKSFWVALAAIAALTMLPVYHRQVDTKLLLLTVPACVMLWAEGGMIGRLALLVNIAGFVLTGDVSWAVLLGFIGNLRLPPFPWFQKMLVALQVIPVPVVLLVMSVFYLWIYVRYCTTETVPAESGSSTDASLGPMGTS